MSDAPTVNESCTHGLIGQSWALECRVAPTPRLEYSLTNKRLRFGSSMGLLAGGQVVV